MSLLFLLSISLFCLFIVGLSLLDIRQQVLAPKLTACKEQPLEQPLISVLIPARNEAAGIGLCLQGLAHQFYPSFEVIVVDDDSTDGTADIARYYQTRLRSLEIVAGVPLPNGWTGKCWACWQAAARARGQWLLFLDADIVPKPELLHTLITHAHSSGADLITLIPLLQMHSLSERLVLPAFQRILYNLYPLHRVSNPCESLAFANGQCLFIRHAVYQTTGGHQAVRSSVLEDTDFGQMVKRSGYRLFAASAPDLLEVRMYTDWSSVAEGLSKNAVAGYRSGGRRSAWVGLRQALIAFAPFYLIGSSITIDFLHYDTPISAVLLIYGMITAILVGICSAWLVRHRYRIAGIWGGLYPLGLAIYFGLAGRALLRLRRRQGVIWKGRVIHDA